MTMNQMYWKQFNSQSRRKKESITYWGLTSYGLKQITTGRNLCYYALTSQQTYSPQKHILP